MIARLPIVLAIFATLAVLDFAHGWTSATDGQPLTCTPGIIASYAYGLAGGGR